MIKLRSDEQKVVSEYIYAIRHRFSSQIYEIILYGSKARGDSHPESDIDLLIIIDTSNKRLKQMILDIGWDVMSNNNFKVFVSPIIFFKKEYEQYQKWNSSFLENVYQEGIKL